MKYKIPEPEISLIGCVLMEEKCFWNTQNILTVDDFSPEVQPIWEAFGNLFKSSTPIDLVTTSGELERMGVKNIDPNDLVEMMNHVPVATHFYSYAKDIKGNTVKRKLDEINISYNPENKNYLDHITKIQEQLDELKSSLPGIKKPSMEQLAKAYEISLEEGGVQTGIKELDKITGGIKRGKLWTLLAYGGTGKTTLILQMMEKMLDEGLKCNLYSCEFIEQDVYSYLNRVTKGFKGKEDIAHYEWKFGFSKERNLNKILQDAMNDKPDIVFIDYVQALQTEDKEIYKHMSNVAYRLMEFTRKTKIPVVALSQISQDDDKTGRIAAKGGGEIHANSDVFIAITRDKEDEDEQRKQQPGFYNSDLVFDRTIYIEKNRGGKQFVKIPIKYEYQTGLYKF